MSVGLPPSDFWTATPGLYAVHMRGIEKAAERRDQELRAGAWMMAMLGRVHPLPDMKEFVTGERDRAAEVKRWVAAWDRVDRALARNH